MPLQDAVLTYFFCYLFDMASFFKQLLHSHAATACQHKKFEYGNEARVILNLNRWLLRRNNLAGLPPGRGFLV